MTSTFGLTAAVLALTVVAGCKMNLTADIYSTDLRDAAAGATDLPTPATLAMEVPSADDCDKHTEQISKLMQGIVDDFAPKGCERVEMNSFLLADIQIPIRASESSWNQADALFGLIASPRETGNIAVMLAVNLSKYETLASRMKKEFHQSVNLGASKVTMVLNNDDRGPLRYKVRDAFVNGEPVHLQEERELGRRRQAEVRLSDVGVAYLARKGATMLFIVASGDGS